MNVLTAYMGYSSECSRNIPSLLVDVHVWHYNLSVKLARGKMDGHNGSNYPIEGNNFTIQ